MDNKVFSKFNVYDQIGYPFVGSVFIIILSLTLSLLTKSSVVPNLNTSNFIIYFISAYLIGNILKALSNLKLINIIISENKDSFSTFDNVVL